MEKMSFNVLLSSVLNSNEFVRRLQIESRLIGNVYQMSLNIIHRYLESLESSSFLTINELSVLINNFEEFKVKVDTGIEADREGWRNNNLNV